MLLIYVFDWCLLFTHCCYCFVNEINVLSSGEELSSKNFNRLFERICRINQLRVIDGTGTERCVQARYIKEYPVGNNDWGDFQTHRRLLGLITVCKFLFII